MVAAGTRLGPYEVTAAIGAGGMGDWRCDGRELFFLAAKGAMMAVDLNLDETVELGTPHALFQTRLIPNGSVDQYEVSPDGKRFLIMSLGSEDREAQPAVISDWPALLTRE